MEGYTLKLKKNVVKNEVVDMIDITTSTENFIANGCMSHNCYLTVKDGKNVNLDPIPNVLEKLEEEAKKRRSFNPLGAIKTKAQKIKEAMDKYGSHQGKDKNKDKDK